MAKRRRKTPAKVYAAACIAWAAFTGFVSVVALVDLPRQLESWRGVVVDSYGVIPPEVRAFLLGVVVGSGVVWAAQRSLATSTCERLKSAGRLLGYVKVRYTWLPLARQDDPRHAMASGGMSWTTRTAFKGRTTRVAFGGFGSYVGPVLCFVEVPRDWGIDIVQDDGAWMYKDGGVGGDGPYDRYAYQYEVKPPGARLLVNVVVVTRDERLGGFRAALDKLLGRTAP